MIRVFWASPRRETPFTVLGFMVNVDDVRERLFADLHKQQLASLLAGVYDLNKTERATGVVQKFAFTNPHGALHIAIKDKQGEVKVWQLTTGSANVLTNAGGVTTGTSERMLQSNWNLFDREGGAALARLDYAKLPKGVCINQPPTVRVLGVTANPKIPSMARNRKPSVAANVAFTTAGACLDDLLKSKMNWSAVLVRVSRHPYILNRSSS